MGKLNPKQRRFISEYLKDQNGTQAAIRAGYSRKTADVQAAQLLGKLRIKEAIEAKLAAIAKDATVTRERILKALLNVAELDPRKLFNADGTMKPIAELPDEIALAISSVESDDSDGELKKLKFWDKVKALELLGKHVKLFDEPIAGGGTPLVINIVPASNPQTDTGH